MAADEHNLCPWGDLSDFVCGFHPVHHGHDQVEHDNVRPLLLAEINGNPAVRGLAQFPTGFTGQQRADAPAHELMVIDNQYVCHGSRDDRGDIHCAEYREAPSVSDRALMLFACFFPISIRPRPAPYPR